VQHLKIAADGPPHVTHILTREAFYKRQITRKGGTQSFGPSRQRSTIEHCDKGKPGAIPGRKATDLLLDRRVAAASGIMSLA